MVGEGGGSERRVRGTRGGGTVKEKSHHINGRREERPVVRRLGRRRYRSPPHLRGAGGEEKEPPESTCMTRPTRMPTHSTLETSGRRAPSKFRRTHGGVGETRVRLGGPWSVGGVPPTKVLRDKSLLPRRVGTPYSSVKGTDKREGLECRTLHPRLPRGPRRWVPPGGTPNGVVFSSRGRHTPALRGLHRSVHGSGVWSDESPTVLPPTRRILTYLLSILRCR